MAAALPAMAAGLNGQLGVGHTTSASRSFGTPFGGLGGATVVYNYQRGKLLVGAEGDIAFGSIIGSDGGYDTSTSAAAHGLGPPASASATCGTAPFSTQPAATPTPSSMASRTTSTARRTCSLTGFGSTNDFGGTRDSTSLGQNINLLRAGLNYHF